MSFATLRQQLADMIANPGVWTVYAYPPPTPTANSISVTPDEPYVEINNNTTSLSLTARFKLHICVPLLDNQGNLGVIEDFILALVPKIDHTYINISAVSQPKILSIPTGDLLTSDVSIELLTSWSQT
jgi:hypothetical protein